MELRHLLAKLECVVKYEVVKMNNLLEPLSWYSRIIPLQQMMQKPENKKEVFVVIYIHWYRKEHFGHILGCFDSLQKAISSFEPLNHQYVLRNMTRTFNAVYEYCTPTNLEELEFGLYMIHCENVPKYTKSIEFLLAIQFPVWVNAWFGRPHTAHTLENLVKASIIMRIQESLAFVDQQPDMHFSTPNDGKLLMKTVILPVIESTKEEQKEEDEQSGWYQVI